MSNIEISKLNITEKKTPSIEKHKDGDKLTRDDFDGGPISIDLIEPGLWLGNLTAASDVNVLNKHKITHILTIDSCPLQRRITELSHITTKFFHIADIAKEDVISYFEETYNFISAGQENGNVLVHCYFGVSRSSTIILAYVMKKYKMTYNEAFDLVKSKRKFVCPNHGFIYQLKLYETMQFTIDKTNSKYRDFRLKVAADKVKKVKILPQTCMDLVKPDPGLVQVKPEPLVYRCKKCRRIVASQSNIIAHIERDSKILWKSKEKHKLLNPPNKPILVRDDSNDDIVSEDNDLEEGPEICQKTYFVEPLAWMKNVTQISQGKLHCPKCNNKLGSFSWVMGCQCPCGTKMAPAFYLVPSKVEWSNVVQNVQITV